MIQIRILPKTFIPKHYAWHLTYNISDTPRHYFQICIIKIILSKQILLLDIIFW